MHLRHVVEGVNVARTSSLLKPWAFLCSEVVTHFPSSFGEAYLWRDCLLKPESGEGI